MHHRLAPRSLPAPRRRTGALLASALLSPVLVAVGAQAPAAAGPAGDVLFEGDACSPVLLVSGPWGTRSVPATATGSLDADGVPASAGPSYVAGRYAPDDVRRHYVVLDTDAVEPGLTRARLRVPSGPQCRGAGEPGTWRLFEVEASPAALADAGSPDPAHFTDLGTGRSFGAASLAEPGQDAVVPLGDAALQALGRGGPLVIGGTWRESPEEPGEVVLTGVRTQPAPAGRRGWSTDPVTVSFHCRSTYPLDAHGCPAPARVSREGVTTVTRTATDVDGVAASDSVRVRIDHTAPRLRLRRDPRGRTFGRIPVLRCVSSDALSGLRRGCQGRFVTVRTRDDGRRVVAFRVRAVDVAGNTRQRHGRFLLR